MDRHARDAVMVFSTVVLRKFCGLPWHDRLLLLETIFWLAVARFVIIALSFRRIGHLAAWPIRHSGISREMRLTEVSRVRWAVVACACRVPWRGMCFEQGLAAQCMLRRRGVPSVLYYGAA